MESWICGVSEVDGAGYLPRLTTMKYVAADTRDFAIQHYHLTASSLDIDTQSTRYVVGNL